MRACSFPFICFEIALSAILSDHCRERRFRCCALLPRAPCFQRLITLLNFFTIATSATSCQIMKRQENQNPYLIATSYLLPEERLLMHALYWHYPVRPILPEKKIEMSNPLPDYGKLRMLETFLDRIALPDLSFVRHHIRPLQEQRIQIPNPKHSFVRHHISLLQR